MLSLTQIVRIVEVYLRNLSFGVVAYLSGGDHHIGAKNVLGFILLRSLLNHIRSHGQSTCSRRDRVAHEPEVRISSQTILELQSGHSDRRKVYVLTICLC
mgnify:CR=1 FL=1